MDLAAHLRHRGLDAYLDAIQATARPCVELVTTQEAITAGCSKLGGMPDLPADFSWPRHALGWYRFIGQVNLADMPATLSAPPGRGLLSFFYAHDEDGECFWGDPDYVRVFHFDELRELLPTTPPAKVQFGSVTRVRLAPGVDVPPWPQSAADEQRWPLPDAMREAYWNLRLALHPSGKYLFGYPLTSSLGYDPTPGPQWLSLLTLDSDRELCWCWHDDDWLVTFIDAHSLQHGDYSQIKADAG